MGNFLVYKSSAGSGKTYTLMVEYLKLVLAYPPNYSRILAITFTNKAANEIKQRILENLKTIADHTPESIPEKSKKLIERIANETGLSESVIFENARVVITSILHNYSDFAVSTIDSFMHSIIKSFAFDLKLSLNFEVELDIPSLINTAVDELISKVGKDDELTTLLQNYVINRAENEENWDITNDLRYYGSALFKERMSGLINILETTNLSEKDYRMICDVHKSLKEEIKATGTKAVDLIYEAGLELSDFRNKSTGIGFYFDKISRGESPNITSTVRSAYNDDNWLVKNSDKSHLLEPVKESLKECGLAIEKLVLECRYMNIIKENFHSTLLLKRISEELNNIRQQRNLIPITDFNKLIGDIVKEQPVPFIYLRVGEKYRHFMIDEFQDTSILQWQNLLPLIENSLGEARLNLIVGDGKQAIYRFKNGDAEQFVNLPSIGNPSGNSVLYQRESLLKSHYTEKHLNTNYRSRVEIVEFNNKFFEFAAPEFIPENSTFYKDVAQEVNPSNTGGLVSFSFINPDNTLNTILELVKNVSADGYSYGDIAILTRVNKDASRVAEALQMENIKVVSSESLLLCSSPEINFLVNWIAFISNPDDLISIQGILEYLYLINPEAARNYKGKPDKSILYLELSECGFVIDPNIFDNLSLYDTAVYLVETFKLNSTAPVYIRFFLDVIINFMQKDRTGLDIDFIEYWKEKNSEFSISASQEKDAIQLLTVHKSKGLDFPVVIYAYPDPHNNHADLTWDIVNFEHEGKSGSVTKVELPLVFKYNKALEGTPLQASYDQEKAKEKVDRFNLYYVAMTRASERLYVILNENAELDGESKYLCQLAAKYLEKSSGVITIGNGDRVAGNYKNFNAFEVGVHENQISDLNYKSGNWKNKITLAQRAPESWTKEISDKSDYGTAIHLILSKLNDINEIKDIINSPVISGLTEEATGKIRQSLVNLMNLEVVDIIFSGGKVIKEQEIISGDGKVYRPDRVVLKEDQTFVVDYKTGLASEKHVIQLNSYMKLLKQMGYPQPLGYLLYLGENNYFQKVELIDF